MNKRSFLSSAAFIALMAAAGAVPQAQAQKGVSLQPSSQWTVNKISAESGQGGYCAAARRFLPNTILTFARNGSDEASFALDFQTPKFRQAEGMQVMLDPGAGEQRAFEVYPVSNQAFVVRLGSDDLFFSALERTGNLRVEFDGQSYNFDLSDIETGQAKLDTCVAGVARPTFRGGSPEMAGYREPRSGSGIQDEIENLKAEVAKLQGAHERMTAVPVEPVVADNTIDIEDNGSLVIDHLSQKITMLEEENQDMKAKLKNANNEEGEGSGLSFLRSPKDVGIIQRLTKENQDLRTALETKQSGDIQAEVLNDQIASLQEENSRLRSGAPVDVDGASSDDVLRVSQENERLKEEIKQKKAEIASVETLRKTVTRLEKENDALRNDAPVTDTEASLEESRQQIETLKSENQRLQKVVQASEVSGDSGFIVKELKEQVGKLSEDLKARDAKLLELSQLTTQVDILKVTNEELEKQLIESALRGPVTPTALSHKIAALETQNDALLQKIQSESDEATGADAAHIETLKAENEQLKKVIADNETLVQENKTLQADIEKLRQENKDLKARIDAAGPGGDTAAQLQKAQDDNQTLQTQLKQKEAELAELGSLREEVKKLREENEKLKGGQPVVADAAAPNPEVETLHRENEALRAQIDSMQGKDSEVADLKKQLQEQEAKLAAADEAVKKAEAAAKAAKAEAAKTAKEAAAKEIEAAEQKAPVPEKKPEETPEVPAEKIAVAATLPEEKPLEIKPDPVAQSALPTPAIEDEMIRLEEKLSQAKASGDQMAIQQAARDYMRLKSRMSASQELSATPVREGESDPAKALLAYAGTGKAPVGDVEKVDTLEASGAPAVEQGRDVPASEDLLQAGGAARPTSDTAVSENINEAQQQEETIKNVPAAPEENLSVRASEDPFGDIKVEDDFSGYELGAGGKVQEQSKEQREAAAGMQPEGAVELPEAPKNEAYRARINDSRMVTPESVKDSYAKSQELFEKPDTSVPATAEWGEASKTNTPSSNAGAGMYKPAVGVPQLLESAKVVSPASVSVVSAASGNDKVSYQWKAGEVYGSAVQTPLSDASRFDSEVQAYLEQTKKRCGQDFAVVPDESTQAGGTRVSTYEIACVGKGVSSSASLIFFSQQGTFTVLAHETPTERLDAAMDIRDRLLRAISGS